MYTIYCTGSSRRNLLQRCKIMIMRNHSSGGVAAIVIHRGIIKPIARFSIKKAFVSFASEFLLF